MKTLAPLAAATAIFLGAANAASAAQFETRIAPATARDGSGAQPRCYVRYIDLGGFRYRFGWYC